jgi:hypothetical protein
VRPVRISAQRLDAVGRAISAALHQHLAVVGGRTEQGGFERKTAEGCTPSVSAKSLSGISGRLGMPT